jgi:creatinine amidohydrolase/Fe(II)-dependent formamide hydrolase-like protein
MHHTAFLAGVSLFIAGCLQAPSPIRECSGPALDADAPRPIVAEDTVFIEEMTWMEVRDALKAGKTTVLVATGGVEHSGPYLATGKHNYILRATTEAIARKLGNTLVAPIVAFVPEGNIDPRTGHMRYPGTISINADTFERLLTDICASLRAQGFRRIILVGDSAGNQRGMEAVAARLDARWQGKTRVHFISEYYDYAAIDRWLEVQGVRQRDEGVHDDFATTAQLLAVDPTAVRMHQRLAAGRFRINGIDLAPVEQTVAWGRKIIDFRAEVTVQAIRKASARDDVQP